MLYDIFCGELASKCAVKAARNRVDFVLPKLFPCINIIFAPTAKRIMKSRAILVSMKKISVSS